MAVTSGQIISINFNKGAIDMVRPNSKAAEIGGRSNIRGGVSRAAFLSDDQLTGQIGNLAGVIAMYGTIDQYLAVRDEANRKPTKGDNGIDLIGSNVDFKASIMRKGLDPLDYYLLVRPKEKHENHIYVSVMVEPLDEHRDPVTVAHVVGWAPTSYVEQYGPNQKRGPDFGNAFAVPNRELFPMMPIRWQGVHYGKVHKALGPDEIMRIRKKFRS
jgi:hypothetical protein